MKRLFRIMLTGLAFGIGAEVPSVLADVWDRLREVDQQQETSHERPSRPVPFTPSTAGQPFGFGKKNPC